MFGFNSGPARYRHLRLSDFTDTAADTVRSATTFMSDITTPTVRLGVTGLSRSGKTVFITALVHALTTGHATPELTSIKLPGFRAFLEPQPDDDVPRFAYEDHLAAISDDPPTWPESTRQISQLRVTLAWKPGDWARRLAGIERRLHIDIIDYPGEWLIDLGLLGQSFEAWSTAALRDAQRMPRDGAVEAWLRFQDRVAADASGAVTSGADGRDAEPVAIEGARLFTAYLQSARQHHQQALASAPGRFLMPGDLAGSPLLTFFPLAKPGSGNTALGALLKRRFESYKVRVVKPFFEDHFAKLDRQIVLVDALSALNAGAEGLRDLDDALESILKVFRTGSHAWLSFLLGRRIDRILFAATKADHLNRRNHDRLRGILAALLHRASERAETAGATVKVEAVAALRATEDVERKSGADMLPCIRGIPAPGEMVAGRRFDGRAQAVVFPGDLPEEPLDAFETGALADGQLQFTRFRPPLVKSAATPVADQGSDAQTRWPHIGLDAAVNFLIGDHLR
jgi:uncharacterized protein